MNKIARFEQFSTNEELFHGYAGGSGESGSKLLDPLFKKLGKLFGDKHTIFSTFVDDEVERQAKSGEIEPKLKALVKSQVFKYTVEKEIKQCEEENLQKLAMDKIKFVKDQVLPNLG